jgi:tetratricopeptide (TPR) repeat protein
MKKLLLVPVMLLVLAMLATLPIAPPAAAQDATQPPQPTRTPVPIICPGFEGAPTEERVNYFMGEGVAYFLSGQYDEAIISFRCVTEQVDENYLDAYLYRAIVYSIRREYELALMDYSSVLEMDGSRVDVYNNRGVVNMALREYERALADFNQALEMDSNYLMAYNNRAVLYTLQRDYDAAIADLQTAIDLTGIDDVVTELTREDRPEDAEDPEYSIADARPYAMLGIVYSAQALDNYDTYLLLTGSRADDRIESAAGALESRFTFDLRLDDGTWLLSASFIEVGSDRAPEPTATPGA